MNPFRYPIWSMMCISVSTRQNCNGYFCCDLLGNAPGPSRVPHSLGTALRWACRIDAIDDHSDDGQVH